VLTVVVSLVPVYLGLAGWLYAVTAWLLGLWFLWLAAVFLRPDRRDMAARRLFLCSITYLPLVFAALVTDRLLFFPAT